MQNVPTVKIEHMFLIYSFLTSDFLSWYLIHTADCVNGMSSPGKTTILKGQGCSMSRLGGINQGFWSPLGCS